MAGKPAEPRGDQHEDTGAGVDAGAPARQEGQELTGPLVVERRAKADGRALILYSEDPAARGRP
jgi:hypothetical protein